MRMTFADRYLMDEIFAHQSYWRDYEYYYAFHWYLRKIKNT